MKRRANLCILFICLVVICFGCAPTDEPRQADTNTKKLEKAIDQKKDSGTQSFDDCIHPIVKKECEDGWCEIPPGCFVYGSPESETEWRAKYSEKQVAVTLTNGFVVASTEVTQSQWKEMGFSNPSPKPQCDNCPVVNVNWFEALAYCNALSQKEGREQCYDLSCCNGSVGEECKGENPHECTKKSFSCTCDVHRYDDPYKCPGYRLPTSPEWEYAARGGTTTATHMGDMTTDTIQCIPDPPLEKIAWHCKNATKIAEVGQKESNPFGLYDTLGNAGEWVDGLYMAKNLEDLSRQSAPLTDPIDLISSQSNERRVMRGGCYLNGPGHLRSAYQFPSPPNYRFDYSSFRPVRTLLNTDGK